MKYKIASAGYEGDLESRVNEMICEGFEPLGGVAFVPETQETKMWFLQAMVLREDNSKQTLPVTLCRMSKQISGDIEMEHIIRFERGYDCIKFECVHGSKSCKPGSGDSHGTHGMNIRFISKGDAGAVQFLLYTGWTPKHSEVSSIGLRHILDWGSHMIPADLGYHSKTKRYDDQEPVDSNCEFCDGQPCYYDGSGLNSNDAMYALVNGGDAALWSFLDAYYHCVFDGGEYPKPAEYEMPIR